jgi:hypothetical protein
MAKGIDLERQLAASGFAQAKTISHLRKKLRIAAMLNCSGQGAAAKQITAGDVTTFFLGLVACESFESAPNVIRLARSGRVYRDRCEGCEPWPFAGVTLENTLGEFLDALFAGNVTSALEPGFDQWQMRFEFQITDGTFRQFSRLIFEVGDQCHRVEFLAINEAIRAALDTPPETGLPEPLQIDRICVVRTKPLRELIAFASAAVNPSKAELPSARPALDNPFLMNGQRPA